MTDEARMAMIGRHVAQLAEHFPNVQIMVSWQTENNETRCARQGSGDWYARLGMAHEFITLDRAKEQAEQFRELLGENEDSE